MSASASSVGAERAAGRRALEARVAAVVGAAHEARWIVEEAGGDEERALDLARRRRAGEPLQHVLGHWSFRTLDVVCDRRALVPRPETEVVVEVALAAVAASDDGERPLELVDLGTGSGVIALSLAVELGPRAHVTAVDRSRAALELAAVNRERAGVGPGQVELVEGEWFAPLPPSLRGRVDLVVSNPPYLAAAELATLDPVVRDFDPEAALVAGERGLEAIEAIVAGAPAVLAPGAPLVVELAPAQAAAAIRVATEAGCASARVERDLAGRLRCLVARW